MSNRAGNGIRTIILTMALGAFAGSAVPDTISTFNTTSEGWDAFSFALAGNFPNFAGSLGGASAVTFNASGGNPGGFISKQDPDGGWEYFRAPAAFLGDQSGTLGGFLSFDLIRLDTGGTALNPRGPLVALTNGSLVLVNSTSSAIPGSSWAGYSVPLSADGSWKVTDPTGAAASSAQFNSVLSSLTGVYILGDYVTNSGANGEILGLDNVKLASAPTTVPEPTSYLFLGIGLAGIVLNKSRMRRSSE